MDQGEWLNLQHGWSAEPWYFFIPALDKSSSANNGLFLNWMASHIFKHSSFESSFNEKLFIPIFRDQIIFQVVKLETLKSFQLYMDSTFEFVSSKYRAKIKKWSDSEISLLAGNLKQTKIISSHFSSSFSCEIIGRVKFSFSLSINF